MVDILNQGMSVVAAPTETRLEEERPHSPIGCISGYSSDSSADIDVEKLDPETLKVRIKAQVEYYFSPQNLVKDHYMVSQMNSEGYIPISIIAGFRKVKKLTEDIDLIIASVAESTVCELNDDNSMVRTHWKRPARTTIILRDVPTDTTEYDIKGLFDETEFSVVSIRSDIGHTWFVTMSTEEESKKAVLHLLSKTLYGQAIKARLKSESFIPPLSMNPNLFAPIPVGQQPPGALYPWPYGGIPQNFPNQYYGIAPGWNPGIAAQYMDPMMQHQRLHEGVNRNHHDQKKYTGGVNKRGSSLRNGLSAADKRVPNNVAGQQYQRAGQSADATSGKMNAFRRSSDRYHQTPSLGVANGTGVGKSTANAGAVVNSNAAIVPSHAVRKTGRPGNKSSGAGSKKLVKVKTPNFTAQDFPTLYDMGKLNLKSHEPFENGSNSASTHENLSEESNDFGANFSEMESTRSQKSKPLAGISQGVNGHLSTVPMSTSGSWAAAASRTPQLKQPMPETVKRPTSRSSGSKNAKMKNETISAIASDKNETQATTSVEVFHEPRPLRGWEKPEVTAKVASDLRNSSASEPAVSISETASTSEDKCSCVATESDINVSCADVSGSENENQPSPLVEKTPNVWSTTKKTYADLVRSNPAIQNSNLEQPVVSNDGESSQSLRAGQQEIANGNFRKTGVGNLRPLRDGNVVFKSSKANHSNDSRGGVNVSSMDINWRRESLHQPQLRGEDK